MRTVNENARTVKVNLNSIDAVKNFCNTASKYDFEIDMISGRYTINGKSLLGLFSLDLSKDITVSVNADEEQANKFFEDVKDYVVE